jgi:hypothetical protein
MIGRSRSDEVASVAQHCLQWHGIYYRIWNRRSQNKSRNRGVLRGTSSGHLLRRPHSSGGDTWIFRRPPHL